MAQRRMFSQDIVSSDAFLDMPISSQVLYFHLAIRADDDGFVTPRTIMRMIGSGIDDLKVLEVKRFILPFESGVIVIKHWLIHNLIRADLYKETLYKKEKATLGLNENGAYTELRNGVSELKAIESPEWLKKRRNGERTADVPQTAPRLGKVRVGKDRIGKVSEESEATSDAPDKPTQKKPKYDEEDMKMTELLISLIVKNTPEWTLKGNIETWAEHINKLHRIDGRTYEQIEYMIRWTQADPFWAQNILSTSKLREKFNDLIPKLKASVTKSVVDKQKASKPKML
jgi:hypothetical protein